MAQLLTVRLNRGDAQPWGFRLQGGKDFGTPLLIQKVNSGSLADQVGLVAGDSVIKINGQNVYDLRHKDAQDVVVRAGNNVEVTIQRGGSTWKPNVTPTGQVPVPNQYGTLSTVTKTSLQHKTPDGRPISAIGTGYNNAARPFNGIKSPVNEPVKSIVNKQYNTPVGIYSDETIAETLSAQAEVLAGGVLGVNFKKNEKIYNSANSEVYKMLQEQEHEPEEPADHQQNIIAPSHQPQPRPVPHIQTHVTKHVSAPVDRPVAPQPNGGLPPGQNICSECERLIVGVFVRIKDKNLHSECFKCATCGTNLKNQGYYNLNNKLYCDIHAKLAALNSPPPGAQGMRPIPIKPDARLGASTISAALNAKSVNTNGTPQFITHPTAQSNYFSPNHSRTSSSASSSSNSGLSHYTNSINSFCTTPIQSSSPAHSREGSFGSSSSPTYNNFIKRQNEKNEFLSNQYSYNKCNNNEINDVTDSHNTMAINYSNNEFKNYNNVETNGNCIVRDGENNLIFKTLDGGTIRSVRPPGRGFVTNYKVSNNYGTPKPFNYSQPPLAGPKSPSSYPPSAPNWVQPKAQPASNYYQNGQNQVIDNSSPTLPAATVIFQTTNHDNLPTQYLENSIKNINITKTNPTMTYDALDSINKSKSINQGYTNGTHNNKINNISLNISVPLPPPPPIPYESKKKFINTENIIMNPTNNNNNYHTEKVFAINETTNSLNNHRHPNNEFPENNPVLRRRNKTKDQNSVLRKSLILESKTIESNDQEVDENRQHNDIIKLIVNDEMEAICCICNKKINRGPFITALGRIWCPDHFVCTTSNCRRPLQDIGFVEEKNQLYCEFCFEKFLAPSCSKCSGKIKGDCLNAIGKHYHPECFVCAYCGKLFGNSPFFLEEGDPYCEADWNELFTTKCFACGFPVEAGDRWVEALNNNYHSQCFNCTMCKKNLEGQSFFAKGGRPYCKNHAR